MLKNLIRFTCSCCGYKTLTDNGPGEICPVCFWENDYFDSDDIWGFSYMNVITLYEAQENYKVLGCCQEKFLKWCRKPLNFEKKDSGWNSVKKLLEDKYKHVYKLVSKVLQLSELLKEPSAQAEYNNYGKLKKLDIKCDYEEAIFFKKCQNELLLKCLTSILAKKSFNKLSTLFVDYYYKGISYYIAWGIMLFAIIEFPPPKT